MKKAYRKQANALTELQAAYLAGFIDGEGCITAGINRTNVSASLQIGSVDFAQLRRLQLETGVGAINKKAKRTAKARHLYVWDVSTCSLGSLLKQVLPYLRLKRRQAEMMILLTDYAYPCRIVGLEQHNIIEQFRILNKRGESVAISN